MYQVNTETVQKLRQQTGCGLLDCKRALELADEEYELAIEILKFYGLAVNHNYSVGRIIRNYWEKQTRLWP